MHVTHFQRRPRPEDFSLERLFCDVRAALPSEVRCRVHVARFVSKGWWRRLYNVLEAPFHRSEVNHVTGDIHYVDFLLPKRRTLLTIPDCAPLARLHGWRRAVLCLFWYALPIRRAGLVSVVSEATKTELLRHVGCPPDKVRVVACCVSHNFQPDPKPFPISKPGILHLGTAPNKNLLRVAEALRGIACRLRIVGRLNPAQEATLRRFNIDYTAASGLSAEEIINDYRASDLVVFASTYEGFGLPILEANAIGRPVVTSRLLSMPDVAGDAACLVDPFDVSSIREGILRVIEDGAYRQQLIENGFVNVRRFSAEAIAQRYIELYEELLSSRASRQL